MTDLRKAAEDLMPILERWKMTYPPCSGADWDKVEALRTALAQPKQEIVDCVYPKCETAGGCNGPCGKKPVDTVNTSQESVDEIEKRKHEGGFMNIDVPNDLIKAMQSFRDRIANDPRSALMYEADHCELGEVINLLKRLKTAPPKREWVGLTRRELDIATLGLEDLGDCFVAIEAKLKEKNHG